MSVTHLSDILTTYGQSPMIATNLATAGDWHYCVIPKNQLCITSPYFSSLQLFSLVSTCIAGLARFNLWLIASSNN
jgi:hypothetical protein